MVKWPAEPVLARRHEGHQPIAARLTGQPEDFVVSEQLAINPTAGDWTWILTERRGQNTAQVAETIAQSAGVTPDQVGYAGRKDRNAVSRQWFSLPPGARLPGLLDNIDILDSLPADRRLQLGDHSGNAFRIRLSAGTTDGENLETWKTALRQSGFANYFGPQRFGHRGDNARVGYDLLVGGRRPRNRQDRLMLNAWQADAFNRCLHEWLSSGSPELDGDLVWSHGLGQAIPRTSSQNGSVTGPLFGSKMDWPSGPALAREQSVLASYGIDPPRLRKLADSQRLYGDRRPFVVVPQALDIRAIENGIELEFSLPPGSYATGLIRELTGLPARMASAHYTDGYDDG